MINKNSARLRRAKQTRLHILDLGVNRLSVHRSNLHIYATIFSADGSKALVTASTIDSGVKATLTSNGSNKTAASIVGKLIAERAKAIGINKVAFDRGGFRYHGRVQALADAAREAGLQF
jgi:large subunit ribosomal protein L18